MLADVLLSCIDVVSQHICLYLYEHMCVLGRYAINTRLYSDFVPDVSVFSCGCVPNKNHYMRHWSISNGAKKCTYNKLWYLYLYASARTFSTLFSLKLLRADFDWSLSMCGTSLQYKREYTECRLIKNKSLGFLNSEIIMVLFMGAWSFLSFVSVMTGSQEFNDINYGSCGLGNDYLIVSRRNVSSNW